MSYDQIAAQSTAHHLARLEGRVRALEKIVLAVVQVLPADQADNEHLSQAIAMWWQETR